MKRVLAVVVVAFLFASGSKASPAPAEAELTELLRQFLAGASRDDRAAHERFWADELVYTGSSGKRIGKADILRELDEPKKADEPKTLYTAEDVHIQQHGDTAVVTFRLVGAAETGGKPFVTRYLNTGTFVRQDGTWRAIAWQATKAALDEEQVRGELLALEKVWNDAQLRSDVDALDRLWADNLVITVPRMPGLTKNEALSVLREKRLRFERYETTDVRVRLQGETALVTGTLARARSREGQVVEDKLQFTKVYLRTPIGWQVTAFQTSESPGEPG
jgi:ketosteroid isomerase-like protein